MRVRRGARGGDAGAGRRASRTADGWRRWPPRRARSIPPGSCTSGIRCTRRGTRRRRASRTCRTSRQPQLFVEGTNDPFIDPHSQLEEAVASCQDATIAWIEGGGHSFEVKGRKRPADEVGAALAPLVADVDARRA